MDEQILLDRFHEALETEPRPGAYERMRLAITRQPVPLQRRPAFRMRWSKMGLRVAAALTAVLIVIALAAVLVATHRAPVGSVPADKDQNVKAYQALVRTDDINLNASTSPHCQTIKDTGCAAAVVPVDAALQRWADDLNAFSTPARFKVLDAALRRHLVQGINELNAAVSFQKAGNQSGFDLAMGAADFEDGWIGSAADAIEASTTATGTSYRDAITFATQSFDACNSCGALPARDCSGTGAQGCLYADETASTAVQAFLLAIVGNPGPGATEARLNADLETADKALVAITNGLISGDSNAVKAAQRSYASAIASIPADAAAASHG